jgi:hypothetical protein
LIARLKQGPQFQNDLRQEIKRDKILAGIPGARARDLIDAAVQSGVIIPHREPRYLKSKGREILHFDLRLNELNARVQVYLGLEMKPPTPLRALLLPPVSQPSPAPAMIQQSLTERYRTHLRQAGISAISLRREERSEILRLLYDFLGKGSGERPYKEQTEEFAAICAAMNPAWSKNRVRSLVNLAQRTRCLVLQGSPISSPASLADGLTVDELVRRCDMHCITSLIAQEPMLELTPAAEALYDSVERVDALNGLIQDMIRANLIRQEGGKLMLYGREPTSAEGETGDITA